MKKQHAYAYKIRIYLSDSRPVVSRLVGTTTGVKQYQN